MVREPDTDSTSAYMSGSDTAQPFDWDPRADAQARIQDAMIQGEELPRPLWYEPAYELSNWPTVHPWPPPFGREATEREISCLNIAIQKIGPITAYSQRNDDVLKYFRLQFQGAWPSNPSTPYIDLTNYDTIPIGIIEYKTRCGFYTFAKEKRDWSWKKMMATKEGQWLLRGNGLGEGEEEHNLERIWVAPVDVGTSIDIDAMCHMMFGYGRMGSWNMPEHIQSIPMWNFIIRRSDGKYFRWMMDREMPNEWYSAVYTPYECSWMLRSAFGQFNFFHDPPFAARYLENEDRRAKEGTIHHAISKCTNSRSEFVPAINSYAVAENTSGGNSSWEQPQLGPQPGQDAHNTHPAPNLHKRVVLEGDWAQSVEFWEDDAFNLWGLKVFRSQPIYKGRAPTGGIKYNSEQYWESSNRDWKTSGWHRHSGYWWDDRNNDDTPW